MISVNGDFYEFFIVNLSVDAVRTQQETGVFFKTDFFYGGLDVRAYAYRLGDDITAFVISGLFGFDDAFVHQFLHMRVVFGNRDNFFVFNLINSAVSDVGHPRAFLIY